MSADTTDRIAGLLAEHQRMLDGPGSCRCGGWPPVSHDVEWPEHVAAVLAEAGVGDVREAEAQWHRYIVLAERAEAALADLRTRVRALADRLEPHARNMQALGEIEVSVPLLACVRDLRALLDGDS